MHSRSVEGAVGRLGITGGRNKMEKNHFSSQIGQTAATKVMGFEVHYRLSVASACHMPSTTYPIS